MSVETGCRSRLGPHMAHALASPLPQVVLLRHSFWNSPYLETYLDKCDGLCLPTQYLDRRGRGISGCLRPA